MADFLQGDPSSFPQHDKLDVDAYRANMARAMAVGQPVPPLPDDPTLPQMLGAAFRQANSVGSLVSSKSLRETLVPTEGSQPITPTTILTDLKAQGLAHHAPLFADVDTRAQYDAKLADLKQELKDRETLQASGGLLAEFALGMVDPVNLIPITGGVRKAQQAGKAVQALSKREFAQQFVAEAAGGAAISEAALQASQVNRDWSDGATNIGASALFGMGLGMGAYGLTRLVGPKTAGKIENRVDAAMDDLRAGGPKLSQRMDDTLKAQEALVPDAVARSAAPEARVTGDGDVPQPARDYAHSDKIDPRLESTLNTPGSAGAAKNDYDMALYDRLNAQLVGIHMDRLIQNVGKVAETEVGGVKILGPLGAAIAQGIRHVRLSLSSDPISVTARKFALGIVPNPNPLEKEGVAGGHRLAVDHHFDEAFAPIVGSKADAVKDVMDLWAVHKKEFNGDIDQFGERVYFAAINDNVDKFGAHPAIEQASKALNEKVYKRIEQGLKEEGFLKEDTQLRGALSYVPWVPRVQQIMKDKEHFIQFHADQMARDFDVGFETATTLAGNRAEALAKATAVHDAEAAVLSAETRKVYNGEGWDTAQKPGSSKREGVRVNKDNMGKIAEAELAVDETKAKWSQAKKDGLAQISEDHKTRLKAGDDKTKSAVARERDKAAFEKTWAADSAKEIKEAEAKVEAVRNERDDKLREIEQKRKWKNSNEELKLKPSDEEAEMLKLNTEEKRIARAEKIANSYYEGVVSSADEFALATGSDALAFPAILKARKAIITQEIAAAKGWVDTNVFNITEAYVRKAGAFVASAKTFRKPLEEVIENADPATPWKGDKIKTTWVADPNATYMRKKIADDYDAAISSSGGGDKEVQLRQGKAEQLRNFDLLLDGRMGRIAQFADPNIQRMAEYAKQFNSLRLMGGSVLSSLGDPVNIAMANGFKATMANGVIPALREYRAAMGLVPKELEPDIFRINRLAGAVLEREANSVLGAMMDINAPLVGKTRGQVFMENAMRQFWKYTGLEFWTQFWKNVTVNTTHARIIDHATRGWSELSAAERTWLVNNRIDEGVLGRIKAMHDSQPEKFSAGIPYGAIDKWTDTEAAARFGYALQQESNFQIVTPGAGSKLAMQFTPMGQLFTQFRSFGLENASSNIARNVALNNIVGEKANNLYGGLFGLVIMGGVVDAVKFAAGDTTLYGNSKKDPNKTSMDLFIDKWRKTPGEALYNALDRSSVFMPITEVSNILQKVGLPNIQGAMSFLTRDEQKKRSGSSKFANRSIWEAAFGPTVGLGDDLVGGARIALGGLSSAVGIGEAFKPTSAQFANGRRLFIGQNIPGLQQVINTVHQKMGTAYEWPKE